jgi:hypothetical protein
LASASSDTTSAQENFEGQNIIGWNYAYDRYWKTRDMKRRRQETTGREDNAM